MKATNADDIGSQLGDFAFDGVERFSEVKVPMKGRERRLVHYGVIVAEIAKLCSESPPSCGRSCHENL